MDRSTVTMVTGSAVEFLAGGCLAKPVAAIGCTASPQLNASNRNLNVSEDNIFPTDIPQQ